MSCVPEGHLFCLQWWKSSLICWISVISVTFIRRIRPDRQSCPCSYLITWVLFYFHVFSPFSSLSRLTAHQAWICHRFHNLGVKLVLGEYLIIAAPALARVWMRGDASCCQPPLNLRLMNFSSIIQLGPNLINNRQLTDIVRRSSSPIMRRLSEDV